MEGWYGQPILAMSADRIYVIPRTDYAIRRGDIPNYFTESVFQQIAMWKSWKRLGNNVFDGGWAEWPAVFRDVIEALEDENNKRLASGNK